ncbi:hypothetical protein LOD99_14094 [Oopsacas minuta]|uniref:Mediator of RNA polymerase II transcription subunit 6 n=1 Tax=Oopsacas minuta TaxID=111878 RepID=A0AAV7KHZ1_9METZ|nr:hypothetical protein LOD99_14094 [Oopsacas minuta]
MADLLATNWSDSTKRHLLNQHTILEYFCQKSNPFYDSTCNNEVCKMQRQDMSYTKNMTGVEYDLLHMQDPYLFIIRKQYRESPSSIIPLNFYSIVDGFVYQCPDLLSIINSRLTQCINEVEQAYTAFSKQTVYRPLEGNVWSFEEKLQRQTQLDAHNDSSLYQRQAVDILLKELVKKFPIEAMYKPREGQLVQNGAGDGSAAPPTSSLPQ